MTLSPFSRAFTEPLCSLFLLRAYLRQNEHPYHVHFCVPASLIFSSCRRHALRFFVMTRRVKPGSDDSLCLPAAVPSSFSLAINLPSPARFLSVYCYNRHGTAYNALSSFPSLAARPGYADCFPCCRRMSFLLRARIVRKRAFIPLIFTQAGSCICYAHMIAHCTRYKSQLCVSARLSVLASAVR